MHWSDVGAANASDAELMAHARAKGFVVLTHDLDFGAILAATGGDSPSVVQLRADNLGLDAMGSIVVAALGQMATELASGALVTINPSRTRLTVLPI